MNPSVCIVTPGYLSSTPRVVKEADALQEAGIDVRVVHTRGGLEHARRHDEDLVQRKSWAVDAVKWSPERLREVGRYVRYTAQQWCAEWMPRALWPYARVAEQIQHRAFPALRRCAAKEPADLYIGHYPAGLAAAGCAADEHGALLGYDAEDFHVGQQPDNQPRIERTDFLERRYLEKCAHVTAASEGIAEALAERYGIDRPQVIHNVFPWAERETIDGQTKDREGDALSLYWFSQTVGLDRGLQDAIRAAGLLDDAVQIHIRGTLYDEVGRELTAVAAENGVADDLYFHSKVPPGKLLSRTAEHDIGLALEQGHTPNRRLCVTNKLFYYPLGGLAIIATDVEGQRRVLEGYGDFSGMYESGDARALAQLLQRWTDAEALAEAKSRALEVAHTRWNWERESEKLVDSVRSLLQGRQSRSNIASATSTG